MEYDVKFIKPIVVNDPTEKNQLETSIANLKKENSILNTKIYEINNEIKNEGHANSKHAKLVSDKESKFFGYFLFFGVCIYVITLMISIYGWQDAFSGWWTLFLLSFLFPITIIVFIYWIASIGDYIKAYRKYSNLSYAKKTNYKLKGWTIFLIILFFVTVTIIYKNAALSRISDLKADIYTLTQDRDRKHDALNRAIAEKVEQQAQISNYEKIFQLGIFITNVQIGNFAYGGRNINNYGARIRSSDTQYLRPKITYLATISNTVTLKIKFINPDGTISRGTSAGFSYSDSYRINAGKNTLELKGWGSNTPGNWLSGDYKIEIWHEDVLLTSHNFTIH